MTLTPRTGDSTVPAPPDARFALVPLDRLSAHEEVVPARADAVQARLVADGVVRRPLVADADSLVVLDGHHRLMALTRLHATHAPVHLVRYADAAVVLESWDPARAPPAKSEVVERALEGRPFPPKSTKHPSLYDLPQEPTGLGELGVE